MALSTVRPPHLPLSTRCGACDDVIFPGEGTVLFMRYEDPVAYRMFNECFSFPPPGCPVAFSGFLLCRNKTCRSCDKSPECALAHEQCFRTVLCLHHEEPNRAVAHVRTMLFYRRPWSKAPYQHVSPPLEHNLLGNIIDKSNLAGLRSLPPELLEIVKHLTPHAHLWRLVSILNVLGRISSSVQPCVLALECVKSWKRGEQSATISNNKHDAVRITIDSYGIQKIERCSQRREFAQESSRHTSYVVEDVTNLRGVKVYNQDGWLRLCLPPGLKDLPVWDTPFPPRLADCFFQTSLPRRWQRLQAIDLEKTKGITFFYSMGSLYGVYAHSSTRSCALPIFTRFAAKRQQHIVWIYLPIGQHDRVIAFGTRRNDQGGLNIVIHTVLHGDIILGPQWQRNVCNRYICRKPPAVFISSEPSEEPHQPIFLGLYSPNGSGTGMSGQFQLPQYEQNDLGYITYFASAPLGNVSCACVFEDKESQFCYGILLEYNDGGLQAVGQCRIGVDLNKKYVLPTEISTRARVWKTCKGRIRHGVQVDFAACASSSRSSPDDWKCQPFSSVHKLLFWFSEDCSIIKVVTK